MIKFRPGIYTMSITKESWYETVKKYEYEMVTESTLRELEVFHERLKDRWTQLNLDYFFKKPFYIRQRDPNYKLLKEEANDLLKAKYLIDDFIRRIKCHSKQN